jgi:hypothetical protein
MKIRIGIALAALLGLLAVAAVADAYKLPFGIAKGEIRRETAQLCAQTNGCVNWHVGPCRRQSLRRVDCVARLDGENGNRCAFVVIARAPGNHYEIAIHHKRVVCASF